MFLSLLNKEEYKPIINKRINKRIKIIPIILLILSYVCGLISSLYTIIFSSLIILYIFQYNEVLIFMIIISISHIILMLICFPTFIISLIYIYSKLFRK